MRKFFKELVEEFIQLFKYRTLIQVLVIRELKARYRGTVFGFFWSFLNPLILMIVYVLIFSVFMRFQMEKYAAFVFCGQLAWIWFASSLNESTYSIINNGGLLKKVYFPAEIFPLIYIGSNLVHFLFTLPLLILFLLLNKVKLNYLILLLPFLWFLQLLFTFGCGLIVSSLTVIFRDLLYIIPNILTLWFFLTPIIYPVSLIPDKFKILLYINPIALLIISYQDILFWGKFPQVKNIIIFVFFSLLIFIIGRSIFNSYKDLFPEEV
jgi:ABC-type polysaccharide/polyol phosphate export permease